MGKKTQTVAALTSLAMFLGSGPAPKRKVRAPAVVEKKLTGWRRQAAEQKAKLPGPGIMPRSWDQQRPASAEPIVRVAPTKPTKAILTMCCGNTGIKTDEHGRQWRCGCGRKPPRAFVAGSYVD